MAQAGGGKSELHRARCRVTRVCMERDTRGRRVREGLSTDSATENKPLSGFGQAVRVKRWSKSPPLREKSRRHGKPHREQGQIGDHEAARFNSRFGGMGSGYWPPRQMILAPVRASGPGRQNSAYSSSKVTPGRAGRRLRTTAPSRPTAQGSSAPGCFAPKTLRMREPQRCDPPRSR